MPILKLTLLCLSILATSACAPFRPDNEHAGICNQMNSKMIFSGGTSNTRNADIERAEQPLLQQSYDSDCYVHPYVTPAKKKKLS